MIPRRNNDPNWLGSTAPAHADDCRQRIATECAIPVECEHGFDVCPTCDPCTCAEAMSDSTCPACGRVRQIKTRSEADRLDRPCASCAATKRNRLRAAAGHYKTYQSRNQHMRASIA